MLLGRGNEALRVDDEVVVFEGLEELVETELFFRAALRLCIIDFVGDGGGERKGLGIDGAEAGGGGFEAHGKEIGDGLKLRRKGVTPGYTTQGITLEVKCKEE